PASCCVVWGVGHNGGASGRTCCETKGSGIVRPRWDFDRSDGAEHLPERFAAAADPAPGAAGAGLAARAEEPGRTRGGAVPGAEEVVAGAMELCPRGGRRADQLCVRACLATNRVVAPGLLRVRQRGREPIFGATADHGGVLSSARA